MTRWLMISMVAAVCGAQSAAAEDVPALERLSVLSFNIWGAGGNEGKSVDETVAALRASGADIVGLQETKLEGEPCTADVCPPRGDSAAKALAEALGYYYYDQTGNNPALWANAILSRYPIEAATANDLGVRIAAGGRVVYAFNIHLTDYPYQPYQLLGIPYGDAPFLKTEAEAIAAAKAARGPAIALLKQDLAEAAGADAVFVFGDFNEPSHLDWTARAAASGRHPLAVAYPTARAIEAEGFSDALRALWPDEMAKPAFTWSPRSDPLATDDHPDRIDYVFVRSAAGRLSSAGILGEKTPQADIVVAPWPSDHRAVFAAIEFRTAAPGQPSSQAD